ncbi:MAG: amidohydrolase [Verrucomicrobiota bacterium]
MKTLLHPSYARPIAMLRLRQFLAFLPLAMVLLPGMPASGESPALKTTPAAAAPNQPAPSRPVLFKGGEIVTLDPSHPSGKAVLVLHGKIEAFDDEALNHPAAKDAELVDLAGATAMPAWVDAHAHPYMRTKVKMDSLDLDDTHSIKEVLALVGKWADSHPKDDWITGRGFKEKVAPVDTFDAHLLDAVCKDRPVVLTGEGGHSVWVNSEALRRAGVNKDTPTPQGSEIPRRPDGEPIGNLIEFNAMDLVQDAMPANSLEQDVAELRGAFDAFATCGITCVQDCYIPADFVPRYLEVAKSGALSCRVNLTPLIHAATWREDIKDAIKARELVEQAAKDGLVDQAGDPLVTVRTVKFFGDGVIEINSAFMTDPFSNARAGDANPRGLPQWTQEELDQALIAADKAGFQVHVHAIGDAAVHQTLDSIEQMAAKNGPRDRRPCIAHCQVIQPGDIARFGKMGVIPVVTPYWAGDRDGVLDRLGPVRNEWQYPYASLAKTGATLAFNSDWPVQTASPLAGMPVAIRRIEPGKTFPLVPGEALTPMQALLGYTQGAAYSVFEESRLGMLKKGMRGDIVVLARNPLTTPVEEWPGIRLLSTWRAGVRTYAAPTAATGGQSHLRKLQSTGGTGVPPV